MADNLKLIEERIDVEIDPTGAPGSILAENHNGIEKEILRKTGKYTGSPFTAKKQLSVFPSGTLSWNSNAMNTVSEFTITTSKLTSDLTDFGKILETMTPGDLIQFKDYSGRTAFLEFQSFTAGSDVSFNPVYNVFVKGFSENLNYIYQTNETSTAVLSMIKKVVDLSLAVLKSERATVPIVNVENVVLLDGNNHFVEFQNNGQSFFDYFILGSNYSSGQNHPLIFRNATDSPIVLKNMISSGTNISGETPLFFPNGLNLVLEPHETVQFCYNSDNNRFDYVGAEFPINISEVNGLQDELDLKASKAYVDGLVVGLLDYRGSHDASTGLFPSSGGSGTAGAVLKGDLWYISVSGTLGGKNVNVGDSILALTDAPGQTSTNWDGMESNIGYVPEDSSNKSTDVETDKTSNIKFPTVKSIYDWAVGKFQNILVSGTTIKTLNNDTLLGSGNIDIPKRLKEILVQNKSQLLGNLQSDVLYLIDGSFSLLAGETIVVPVGGLNIMGYSFDASRIGSYGVANHTIFTSPAGGSGNLIVHNIAFNATGTGAKVFDITDVDGTHALEMITVNFEGCKSLGKIRNYRQGTGITIGIYGCADGLMLSGTWTGFKITNTNCFGFASTGTLFKKDTDTIFSNRFYLEINADFVTGSKLADFQASNFSLNELFQINSSILKYNGTIDDNNSVVVIPNIKANDVKCLWRSNVGLPDTATEKYIENATVTGSYVVNWLVDTYYLTMTGNTTFTESNLPATGKNTEEIKIYLAGNFTPTFPTAWNTNKVGTFKPGEMNQITLKFIKTGVYFMKIDNSLTVYPAPNVSGVSPASILPGATSVLTVYGSFFTPATIVSIATHTVNSVTFINQGELLLSVTTTSAEGDFALTISNGTTVIYNNRVSVYLGVVFIPTSLDWENITGSIDLSVSGESKTLVYNSFGTANWNKNFDYTKNYSVRFKFNTTPLGVKTQGAQNDYYLYLRKASDNSNYYGVFLRREGTTHYALSLWNLTTGNTFYIKSYIPSDNTIQSFDLLCQDNLEFRSVSGVMYFYINGVLKHTFASDLVTSNLKFYNKVGDCNFVNIKYIELA